MRMGCTSHAHDRREALAGSFSPVAGLAALAHDRLGPACSHPGCPHFIHAHARHPAVVIGSAQPSPVVPASDQQQPTIAFRLAHAAHA